MRISPSILCDEASAYAFVERRAWPDGPVCPHCHSGRAGRLNGASTRIGTYKCYGCRQPFTVKIGTIFESSHVPLHVWLQAVYLVSASKDRLSAHEIGNRLGVTAKTACYMVRRIREALDRDASHGDGAARGVANGSRVRTRAVPAAAEPPRNRRQKGARGIKPIASRG